MWSSRPALVTAMRTHLGIHADRFASPLDVHGHDLRYWSMYSRDKAFSAHTDAYSCRWQGYSYVLAGTDTACIEKATKWALWSALQSPEPTATVLAVPRSRTAKGKPIYYSWIEQYPKYCTTLTTIPHSDTPLHKEDIWWSNGDQEGQSSKWDLELVLVSNLPAQAELRHKSARLTQFLNAVAALKGAPAAPNKTRRAHAATVAKLMQAGECTWQQQE